MADLGESDARRGQLLVNHLQNTNFAKILLRN